MASVLLKTHVYGSALTGTLNGGLLHIHSGFVAVQDVCAIRQDLSMLPHE